MIQAKVFLDDMPTETPTETPLAPRVQRVDLHADGRLVLELFGGGGRIVRVWDPREPAALLGVRAERPPHEEGVRPPAAQAVLREALVPSVLSSERTIDDVGVLELTFTHKTGRRVALVFESRARPPRFALLALKSDGPRVLYASGPRRADDGRLFDKGQRYVLPTSSPPLSDARATDDAPPSTTPAREPASPRVEARRALAREKKRLLRLINALDDDLARHGDPAALLRDGELLKGALSLIARGQERVVVSDEQGRDHVIALDPREGAVGNMERLFKRARRARSAAEHVAPRREELARRVVDVEARMAALEEGAQDDEAAIEAARALVGERSSGGGKRARVRPETGKRLPYRVFVGAGGIEILVGRSARDNDALTFHVARGNDVWLHTRDAPGSHVVVRTPRERLAPALLHDAAALALWFSPLRGSRRGEVSYTSCKHVKKPGRDAPPGLVHVKDERAIHVVIDDARMDALLATEKSDG